jgi:hypothetical protein
MPLTERNGLTLYEVPHTVRITDNLNRRGAEDYTNGELQEEMKEVAMLEESGEVYRDEGYLRYVKRRDEETKRWRAAKRNSA